MVNPLFRVIFVHTKDIPSILSIMGESKNISLSAAFLAYLKQNGLRETYERKVIIEALSQFVGHFDLKSLAANIMSTGHRVSRATLYNTVSLLVKADLVRRQQFSNGQYLYECTLRLPAGNQLHLICNTCGKITDLRNTNVTRELNRMKFGSFAPEYISMSVYGTCAKCARRQRRNSSMSAQQLKLFE